MPRGATLIYKCRSCGLEDNSWHTPDWQRTWTELDLDGVSGPHKEKADGHVLTRRTMHHCRDGTIGIADLIRIEPDPKETP
jgi:hypothetical protein